MDLNIDWFDIKIKGLSKQYKILQLSDLHLTEFYEDEISIALKEMPGRKELFDKETDYQYDRYQLLKNFYTYAEENNCDYILLTGDIIDTPTRKNFDYLSEVVNNSNVKTIYMLGNHDWTYTENYQSEEQFERYIPEFANIFGEKTVDDKGNIIIEWNYDNEVYDFGDFVMFCVSNGDYTFSEDALEKLEYFSKENIPVILCIHIPIVCDTLKDDVTKVWGKDISIGSQDIPVNERTHKFIDSVKSESSSVATVISGHIHFGHIDTVNTAKDITQYISAPSYNANARIFNIIGE